jgi:hypothetical protein
MASCNEGTLLTRPQEVEHRIAGVPVWELPTRGKDTHTLIGM